jgi:hypothetical protein
MSSRIYAPRPPMSSRTYASSRLAAADDARPAGPSGISSRALRGRAHSTAVGRRINTSSGDPEPLRWWSSFAAAVGVYPKPPTPPLSPVLGLTYPSALRRSLWQGALTGAPTPSTIHQGEGESGLRGGHTCPSPFVHGEETGPGPGLGLCPGQSRRLGFCLKPHFAPGIAPLALVARHFPGAW